MAVKMLLAALLLRLCGRIPEGDVAVWFAAADPEEEVMR
jgi:hypothetical protein